MAAPWLRRLKLKKKISLQFHKRIESIQLVNLCVIQFIGNKKVQVENYWMGSSSAGQYMEATEECDSQV